MEIDADQFIGIKGYDARGKRLATWEIAKIEELEPLRFPDPSDDDSPENDMNEEEENLDPDADKSEQQVRDELTGQTSLNFDEE
jgi:topoisomerase-4 subunit A